MLTTLFLTLVAPASPIPQEESWRYVVPAEGDALRRPPLTAVPLSSERPEDVTVNVELEGAFQRYGMLRYGDPDSTRIAILLDHRTPSEAVLYVDAGRDLAIDPEDRAGELGRAWELSLAVETRDAEGSYLLVPRRVAFELGRTGAILGSATLGWLEGDVEIGERTVRALRRDGDANGFFHDPRDQLWLDLDGDGEWSPLEELFVMQPILPLLGGRYAVRADRLGLQLSLELLEGAGRVALAVPGADGAARTDLLDVQALLVGRDGSAVLARAPGPPTELPIGEYRLGMVTLSVADPAGGQPWGFVFSESGRRGEARWHTVAKDEELVLDPLGEPELVVSWPHAGEPVTRGSWLGVRTYLYTGGGLLINTAYRGTEVPVFSTLQAEIALLDEHGERRAIATSGFA